MRALSDVKAFVEMDMCLKRLRTTAFVSFEPFCLYRANGHVGTIPTYRVYRLYDFISFLVNASKISAF